MELNQSRQRSAIETVCNVSVGCVVAFIANMAILPAFGYMPTTGDNIKLSAIYTALSLVRSYLVRRIFNRI